MRPHWRSTGLAAGAMLLLRCGSSHGAGSSAGSASMGSTASNASGTATGGVSGATGSGASTSGGGAGSGSTRASVSGASTSSTAPPRLVTSSPGAYWQTNGTLSPVTGGAATVTVDDGSPQQTWEGFGGAFNEVGWNVLLMLTQADRDRALDLLFGADAAHFDLGLIPMGASDYALARYTEDEVPSGSTDVALASFSIDEDMKFLVPYVQAALKVNPNIRLWSSSWTPPTWMKAGPFQGGNQVSPFDGGKMVDNAQYLAAYAAYFVKWLAAYEQQGIHVSLVSPQNEPSDAQNHPSCVWTSALYTKFIGEFLGPALAAAGGKTQIMLGTMSNADVLADPTVVTAVMGDAAARSFVKVFGYQWGMKASVAGDTTTYALPIWQTEHNAGNFPVTLAGENPPPGPFDSTMAPNDQTYGAESWGLIRDWIKAGVTSYSAWNLVLDTVGLGLDTTQVWPQDALLTVDTSTKTLNVTPAYYVFRHLAQFVVPGAKVVATTGGDAVAFKNPDGSLVAVMYNAGAATDYVVAVGGQKLQFAMPASGWATVDYAASP